MLDHRLLNSEEIPLFAHPKLSVLSDHVSIFSLSGNSGTKKLTFCNFYSTSDLRSPADSYPLVTRRYLRKSAWSNSFISGDYPRSRPQHHSIPPRWSYSILEKSLKSICTTPHLRVGIHNGRTETSVLCKKPTIFYLGARGEGLECSERAESIINRKNIFFYIEAIPQFFF